MRLAIISLMAVLAMVLPAAAQTVQVEIIGQVEWNQVTFGIFQGVQTGDAVTVSFRVDADTYENSTNYNTRGYVIDPASYSFTVGNVTVGLQDPFPAGMTPYFVIRESDPVADGFFLSTGVDWPTGVPLNEVGHIDQFTNTFEVGYEGDTLASLDILDAVGMYQFDGLTSYYFNVNDGPFEAIGCEFSQMTISTSVATEAASWGEVKSLFR